MKTSFTQFILALAFLNSNGRKMICRVVRISRDYQLLKVVVLNVLQHLNAVLHAQQFGALCIVTSLLLVPGCATVTSPPGDVTSQDLRVNTDPPKARCTLSRYGSSIGAIDSTPGSIRIGKSIANVHVVCKKDGYFDAEETVHSHLQKAFYGNLLWALGAGYAMVWDLSTGAPWQYDPDLNVRLIRSEFSSEAEREEYFVNLSAWVKDEFKTASDRVVRECQADKCDQQIKKLKDQETEELKQIEQQRQLTRLKQT